MAADFVKAIDQSQGTCLLPFGILEKHGPQLPLGTDLINVRYARCMEPRKSTPWFFPNTISDRLSSEHEPGTIAYSAKLQLEPLQETTDEMARNGCKKIAIVNGHGGNNSLLPFFAQSQMASPHDYVVYVNQHTDPAGPSGPEVDDRFTRRRKRNFPHHDLAARPGPPRSRRQREWRRPNRRSAPWSRDGNLVVREIPRALRRRRYRRQHRPRRIPHESLDRRLSQRHPRRQSR